MQRQQTPNNGHRPGRQGMYNACICSMAMAMANSASNLSSGQVCTSAKNIYKGEARSDTFIDCEHAATTKCNPNSTQCFIYLFALYPRFIINIFFVHSELVLAGKA